MNAIIVMTLAITAYLVVACILSLIVGRAVNAHQNRKVGVTKTDVRTLVHEAEQFLKSH